jgi:hypothetical protein
VVVTAGDRRIVRAAPAADRRAAARSAALAKGRGLKTFASIACSSRLAGSDGKPSPPRSRGALIAVLPGGTGPVSIRRLRFSVKTDPGSLGRLLGPLDRRLVSTLVDGMDVQGAAWHPEGVSYVRVRAGVRCTDGSLPDCSSSVPGWLGADLPGRSPAVCPLTRRDASVDRASAR